MKLETSREANDEGVPIDDMRHGEVAVIVATGSPLYEVRPGAVIARAAYEVVILGAESGQARYRNMDYFRNYDTRVRALRPGEQVVITERS